MRSGGEADKLANRYEGLWTTYQLFELLKGDALSLTPESLDEGIGVEFCKVLEDGVREFHSVKIQTSSSTWTTRAMARKGRNGRSILDDLLRKTKANTSHLVCFVSEVSANNLRMLCEQARNAEEYSTFLRYLDVANKDIQGDFTKVLVPRCGDNGETAWYQLRRIRVETVTQSFLTENIEWHIEQEFYRHDGNPINVGDTRRLLAEFILDSLRKEITQSKLLDFLEGEKIGRRNWALDSRIKLILKEGNQRYLRQTSAQLINGSPIPRHEAAAAFQRITEQPAKFGIFIGIAGLGKSCAMAELLDRLIRAEIPCFALRMDLPTDELSARGLGKKLNLPASPVAVLDGMAGGSFSVLLVDQLDALSLASGRNQNAWQVFEDLMDEARKCPRLKVWLACRGFDLEHDFRLRSLVHREKANQITMAPLDLDAVKAEILKASANPQMLNAKQLEMLRTPMHLSLYLESEPAGKPPFQTVVELYDSYWSHKQEVITVRLGRPPRWVEIIDLLCSHLTSGVPVAAEMLEDTFTEDVSQMASANVIVKENSTYRFFHEGFFDYAFARRFVTLGRRLVGDLLLNNDQDFTVRGPVRQVLAYVRSKDRPRYFLELSQLLNESSVRAHVQRLVLDWMRTLQDPTPEEAQILKLDAI